MTLSELFAATAADMRKVAEAASDAPWSAGYWYEGEFMYQYGSYGWYLTGPSGSPEVEDSEQGKADVQHIAAWDPTVTPLVAVLLDGIATRHVNTPLAGAVNPRGYCIGCGGYGGGWTCPDVTEAIELCDAWWKSRGIEPKELDHVRP